MATSGSVNFTQSRNELILDALQLVGIYGIGRTVSAEDLTVCNNALNKMVKAWGAKGLHLWSKQEAILFLTPGTNMYELGNNGARAANAEDVIVTQYTTNVTTSFTITSTAGIAVSDPIGFVQNDGTVYWTVVSSITDGTTLVVASEPTGDVSAGNLVYSYTNTIDKPLQLVDGRIRTGINNTINDRLITPLPYREYQSLPAKASAGSTTQFTYNPNNLSGTLYLWPTPFTGTERFHFTYERILEDLDQASNNFDFPSEWLETLTWQLAIRIAPAFGKTQKAAEMLPIASQMLEDLLDWDSEKDYIELRLDTTGY